MSSKYVGIEEARKTLGDLITAAQQGADITITRNGKPAARLIPYQEAAMHTSHTETFDLNRDGLADLALSRELEERTTAALEGEQGAEIRDEIQREITRHLREYGVNADTGEWLGDWSAADVVVQVLDRHA